MTNKMGQQQSQTYPRYWKDLLMQRNDEYDPWAGRRENGIPRNIDAGGTFVYLPNSMPVGQGNPISRMPAGVGGQHMNPMAAIPGGVGGMPNVLGAAGAAGQNMNPMAAMLGLLPNAMPNIHAPGNFGGATTAEEWVELAMQGAGADQGLDPAIHAQLRAHLLQVARNMGLP